jgi:hypothetical protein
MIGPVTAVTNGVTRTFSWRGRAARSEYWFYLLFGWAVIVALVLTSELVKADAVKVVVGLVAWVMWFSMFWAMACRPHETGRGIVDADRVRAANRPILLLPGKSRGIDQQLREKPRSSVVIASRLSLDVPCSGTVSVPEKRDIQLAATH